MVRGEKINRWCWSDIPQELLEEILRKLTVVDYLNCRRVCRSWRHKYDDAVATKGTCPPAPQFPFLMLLPHGYCLKPPPYPFLTRIIKPAILSDITQEEPTSYTIPFQTWKDRYFQFRQMFSVQGWLVFQNIYHSENQNYDSIMFSNPLSGEEFELPHLPLFPGQVCSLGISVELVFSSAPPDSSDFVVVACATLLNVEGRWMQLLAFCKVSDKKWTLLPTDPSPNFPFHAFIILDWKLYAMNKDPSRSGSVAIFNLRDSNIISFKNLEKVRIPRNYHHFDYCMFARDGDEILLVVHTFQNSQTKGFHVFKLDIGGSKWIEVDDLGDRVLLMDSAGVQVISSKEINLPRNLSGGNCVFFCNTYYPEIGVFTLKDKRITSFPSSLFSQVYGGRRRCLWFMPSPY